MLGHIAAYMYMYMDDTNTQSLLLLHYKRGQLLNHYSICRGVHIIIERCYTVCTIVDLKIVFPQNQGGPPGLTLG